MLWSKRKENVQITTSHKLYFQYILIIITRHLREERNGTKCTNRICRASRVRGPDAIDESLIMISAHFYEQQFCSQFIYLSLTPGLRWSDTPAFCNPFFTHQIHTGVS